MSYNRCVEATHLIDLILSFHVNPGDQIQIVRLAGKCLYSLSCLVGPPFLLYILTLFHVVLSEMISDISLNSVASGFHSHYHYEVGPLLVSVSSQEFALTFFTSYWRRRLHCTDRKLITG